MEQQQLLQGRQPQVQVGEGQETSASGWVQQLAALNNSLDEATADWQVLQQPAAWHLAGSVTSGGQEARQALQKLSEDAVQLLCRRLVTAGAPAAVCSAVLRWALLPKVRDLASSAPQALVECMQSAGQLTENGPCMYAYAYVCVCVCMPCMCECLSSQFIGVRTTVLESVQVLQFGVLETPEWHAQLLMQQASLALQWLQAPLLECCPKRAMPPPAAPHRSSPSLLHLTAPIQHPVTAACCQPALLLEEVLRPLLLSPDLRPPQAQLLTKLIKQEPGIRAGCVRCCSSHMACACTAP